MGYLSIAPCVQRPLLWVKIRSPQGEGILGRVAPCFKIPRLEGEGSLVRPLVVCPVHVKPASSQGLVEADEAKDLVLPALGQLVLGSVLCR